MSDKAKKIKQVHNSILKTITSIETHLKKIKATLKKLESINVSDQKLQKSSQKNLNQSENNSKEKTQIIEGYFNGYLMIGSDQKEYPVPLNYASKSKLIPGDKLKLRITENGKLIYKLINAVKRKHQKATLSLTNENKYIALADDGKSYFLNHAAVTYFKGEAGDTLHIVTNINGTGDFAAIEGIVKQ